MAATAPVPAVRPRHGVEFRAHEMFAPGAAVPALAKYPDLVY